MSGGMLYNQIKTILPAFAFEGAYQDALEILSGNVNSTYHLFYNGPAGKKEYVLQRINSFVFQDPAAVMRNIALVTEHLRHSLQKAGIDTARRVLELIPTTRGDIFYQDPTGGCWRATRFIDDATAPDRVDTPEQLFEIGRGFGTFQRLLYDFPADALTATIPNFHNTPKRFYAFVHAIDMDAAGRARQADDEIEFFFDRRLMMSKIVRLMDAGTLPPRVTHNDTKANNVMIDNRTGHAICVLDLDTVMPGSSLYDYGDAVRYGASTAAEDEEDTSRIALDMDKARAFTEGFIEETNGFLTEEELRLLPLGIKVITCELAMRFLKDYLENDVYFKVNSPTHNLIRARAQIALLKDIEAREDDLNRMIASLLHKAIPNK